MNKWENRLHAGGYCWANNPTFAALLRGLGFRVSEVTAKVFKNWANLDPLDTVARNKWGTITHIVLIVDWPGSGGERYVCDVGFGGDGCPIPYVFCSAHLWTRLTRPAFRCATVRLWPG